MVGLRLAGKFNDLSIGARWLEKDERLTTSFILCTLHAEEQQCIVRVHISLQGKS